MTIAGEIEPGARMRVLKQAFWLNISDFWTGVARLRGSLGQALRNQCFSVVCQLSSAIIWMLSCYQWAGHWTAKVGFFLELLLYKGLGRRGIKDHTLRNQCRRLHTRPTCSPDLRTCPKISEKV